MEKQCRYCAMMIPKAAKICPHCRKTLGWTLPAKIGVALLFLFIFGGLFGRGTSPPVRETATLPPINITAEQLYAEYQANEVAGDQKFKDRILTVTGTIRTIGKTIGDLPYISLATGKWSNQVMIHFPSKVVDHKLATYKQGDQLTATGVCKGMTVGIVGISLR